MFIILLQEFLQRKQIILYGTTHPAMFLLRTGRMESGEGFVFVWQTDWGLKSLKQSSVIIFEGSLSESVFLPPRGWIYLRGCATENRMRVLSLWSWQSTSAVTQIQGDLGETEHEHTFWEWLSGSRVFNHTHPLYFKSSIWKHPIKTKHGPWHSNSSVKIQIPWVLFQADRPRNSYWFVFYSSKTTTHATGRGLEVKPASSIILQMQLFQARTSSLCGSWPH